MNFLVEVLEKHDSLLPHILTFACLNTVPNFTEAGILPFHIGKAKLPCFASAAVFNPVRRPNPQALACMRRVEVHLRQAVPA
jgi:hypothetical protein